MWLSGVVITLSIPFLIYVYHPLPLTNFKLAMVNGLYFLVSVISQAMV